MAVACLVTLAVSTLVGGLVLALAGVDDPGDASLVVVALLQASLWLGAVGSLVVVLRARGATVADLGWRVRARDVPVGIALGVACQLLLVRIVSGPWVDLLGRDLDDLREPACRLADKADDPLGVALLVLITVVGAPVVEELFFRGFVQRAAVAHLGRVVGLVATALLFGLTHFQLLQFPALVAFGLVLGVLADRTGRLGSSIVAHMAFNATTIVLLLALASSGDDGQCRDVLGSVLR